MNAEVPSIVDAQTQSGIQLHRLTRIRQRLQLADCPAIVLFDPVNIRYATGSRNMQVWTMHNVCRYTVVFANGETVLFELGSSAHLARDYGDDIRPSLSTDFLAVGPRGAEMSRRWTESMISLLREKGIAENRLAIDRAALGLVQECQRQGLRLLEGQSIMEQARAIKSVDEIEVLRRSLLTCEQSVTAMRERLEPGGHEGVKLEQPVWLGADGVVVLSEYPFELDYL